MAKILIMKSETVTQTSQNVTMPKNFPYKIDALDVLVTKKRIVLSCISLFIQSWDSPITNNCPSKNSKVNKPIE